MAKKRNRRRATQVETIFYKLYTEHQAARAEGKTPRYIPVHEFMGEMYVQPLGKWGYVSYECSARLSGIMSENPGLLSRVKIEGKSGAKYFGYRFSLEVKPDLIRDESLRALHSKMKPKS